MLESADAGNRVETVLAASPAATPAIPATLQASLIARLDRLGTAAKEVAQVSAVLGRTFGYELIDRVDDRADLDVALGQLTDAGLLFCRGVPPHSSYLFKHALVQDAAYGTLLRGRRQELHARVAAVLEADFADLALDRPEVLAHHHTQARSIDRAVFYLTKAGLKALEGSAMSEAASQLAKALDLMVDLPAGGERSAQELALLTALGRALTASKGYAAPETGQAYARARRLCEDLGDVTTLVRVGYGQYLYHLIRAEIGECHRVAEEILAFAEKTRSDEARILGCRTLGVSLFESGQLEAARVQLEVASGLLKEQRQRGAANRGDAGVTVPAWLAFVAAFQGYADQAARIRDLSVREANSTTSLHSRVFGLAFAAGTCCVLRQYDDLLARADAICALATELNFPFMLAWGMAFRGIAELHAGAGGGQAAWTDWPYTGKQTQNGPYPFGSDAM